VKLVVGSWDKYFASRKHWLGSGCMGRERAVGGRQVKSNASKSSGASSEVAGMACFLRKK